jgi:hypothetical protein
MEGYTMTRAFNTAYFCQSLRLAVDELVLSGNDNWEQGDSPEYCGDVPTPRREALDLIESVADNLRLALGKEVLAFSSQDMRRGMDKTVASLVAPYSCS